MEQFTPQPKATITEEVTLRRTIEVPWERFHFIFDFNPGVLEVEVDARCTTEDLQAYFWAQAYADIQHGLQLCYNQGFIPEEDVGPHLIQVREFRDHRLTTPLWVVFLACLATAGVAGFWFVLQILIGQRMAEPVVCAVWMRRPCMEGTISETIDVDAWPTWDQVADSDASAPQSGQLIPFPQRRVA